MKTPSRGSRESHPTRRFARSVSWVPRRSPWELRSYGVAERPCLFWTMRFCAGAIKWRPGRPPRPRLAFDAFTRERRRPKLERHQAVLRRRRRECHSALIGSCSAPRPAARKVFFLPRAGNALLRPEWRRFESENVVELRPVALDRCQAIERTTVGVEEHGAVGKNAGPESPVVRPLNLPATCAFHHRCARDHEAVELR
jgi:hypothetical protein